MNTALAPNQRTTTVLAQTPVRMYARRGAILIGLTASLVVAGLLVLTPDLIASAPLWVFWALAMTGVVVTYASDEARHQMLSGRQSRRTRRWMANSQS